MQQKKQSIPCAIPIIPGANTSDSQEKQAEAFLASLNRNSPHEKAFPNQKTLAAYSRKAKELVRAINKRMLDDSPLSIVEWMSTKRKTIQPSSFRFYKAALLHHLRSMPCSKEDDVDIELKSSIQMLEEMHPLPSAQPRRTSAKKRKFLKPAEMNLLISALLARRGKWSSISASYIKAAVIAGLRPSEWFDVNIEDGEPGGLTISIKNGKNTNGRSTGERREIFIPDEANSSDVLDFIKIIEQLKQSSRDFELIQKSIAKPIHETCKKLFSRSINISPYTARHQFSANTKNVYSKAEVAVLHGHRSIETSGRHYGKRKSGFPEFRLAYEARQNSVENFTNDGTISE